jgi:hypothetical protein
MENQRSIYEPNPSFQFEELLQFISPVVSGTNYFIRFLTNTQIPFYVQTPKCKSKQGLITSGKKMFSDLVFSHEDEMFIQWIERLETFCQKTLFKNREKWFDTELELHDIENSFISILKVYKSGKQYTLRANIPTRLGKCSLKIYDENENEVPPESILESTDFVTILEFQGIRCSAKSFQIEMEIKQMMKLDPVDFFETCLLKNKRVLPSSTPEENTELSPIHLECDNLENHSENHSELDTQEQIFEIKNDLEQKIETETEKKEEDPLLLDGEVEIHLDEQVEKIQLKNRNDVYYKMYKDAKRKAKMARNLALTSYLEAKRIKNTYLLNDSHDSSESDGEDFIENFSENLKYSKDTE